MKPNMLIHWFLRIVCLLAMSACFGVLLAACGGGSDDQPADEHRDVQPVRCEASGTVGACT